MECANYLVLGDETMSYVSVLKFFPIVLKLEGIYSNSEIIRRYLVC